MLCFFDCNQGQIIIKIIKNASCTKCCSPVVPVYALEPVELPTLPSKRNFLEDYIIYPKEGEWYFLLWENKLMLLLMISCKN